MEGKENTRGEGGGGLLLSKPAPTRPSLSLPPRSSEGVMSNTSTGLAGLGFSPGPMTLVSSFFAEHDPDSECKSFSQLLAGAMASPPARESSSKPSVASSQAHGSSSSSSAKFKSMPPSSIPIPVQRSPFLCLPHGVSPSSLLDSPMLLANSQVEPSPTTGNFPLAPIKEENSEKESGSNFVFKPFAKGPFEISHQQVLAQIQAQAQAQAQVQAQGQVQAHKPPCPDTNFSSPGIGANAVSSIAVTPEKKTESQSETKHPIGSSSKESNQIVAVSVPPVPVVEKPSADGYNWRKYGQKQVKGSEYPRSYYKCTHTNCPVKKKVERSRNGQVTEIVYKGEHNHPKPQPTRRMAIVSHQYLSNSGQEVAIPRSGDMKARGNEFSPGFSGDPGGRNERNGDGSDPSTSVKVNNGNGSPEHSGSSDDQDAAADDEPDSKRSKKEKKEKEVHVVQPLRTIREPRVVVQTRSDVDILDDGYRWRKYGQKVVKGNPHPRSYYKCTNMGCPVRKHVERASNDAKAVITTYEGKHNHDVPAARHNTHDLTTVSPAQTANISVSSSVVTNVVKGQQIGNKQSAFSRISESRSEGRNDANTESGVGENAPTIYNNNYCENIEITAPSGTGSLSYSTNAERSLGNNDNVSVSGTTEALVTVKPKEEQ